MRYRVVVLIALVIGLICGASVAQGGIVAVGPFVGAESESWESFPNYDQAGNLPDPTSIMGGKAEIFNSQMIVYELGTAATFELADNGWAQTADGIKGMGINRADQVTTITFASPVTAFGAFWGICSVDGGNEVVTFYDAKGNVIGSPQSFHYARSQHDGVLEWHGYSSTVPIAMMTYSGSFTVIDGLQAVPEPSTLLLAFVGAVSLTFAIRRRSCGGQLSTEC